jgi:hypothetical protein
MKKLITFVSIIQIVGPRNLLLVILEMDFERSSEKMLYRSVQKNRNTKKPGNARHHILLNLFL